MRLFAPFVPLWRLRWLLSMPQRGIAAANSVGVRYCRPVGILAAGCNGIGFDAVKVEAGAKGRTGSGIDVMKVDDWPKGRAGAGTDVANVGDRVSCGWV